MVFALWSLYTTSSTFDVALKGAKPRPRPPSSHPPTPVVGHRSREGGLISQTQPLM